MITGGDQFSGRVSVGIRRAFGVEDKIRARAETDADNAGDYPGNPPETPFCLPDTEPEQAERQQQYAPVRQGSDALARLGAGSAATHAVIWLITSMPAANGLTA